MADQMLALRAWSDETRPDLVEDDLARRPLAICVSGGGFRSFSCVMGELRALHGLGLLDHSGLLSGVSGGAWATAAYAYAPGELADRLGDVPSPDALTLDALTQVIDENHLAHPITQMDAMTYARALQEQEVQPSRFFSRILGDQLLKPLGVDVGRRFLAGGPDHFADLAARNPQLAADDVLMPIAGRVPVVTGATMMVRGAEKYEYIPVELAASSVSTAWPVEGWPVRTIELPAIMGLPRSDLGTGTVHVDVGEAFGLEDLLASTGGAPGGVLVEIATWLGLHTDNLVLQSAHWLGLDFAPFLVDGGYVENTGLLAALRRGADRIAVFVNSNTRLGNRHSPFTVEGLEGQIARLFGRTPSFGAYAGDPLPLFPEDELLPLAEALAASKARGEMPYALLDHRLRPDNALGLPERMVRIYWHLNEVPEGWAAQLPPDTQRAFGTFGELHAVPHLAVAFAQGGYLFRLRPMQLGAMVALHDHALRSRPDEVWSALLDGPDPL